MTVSPSQKAVQGTEDPVLSPGRQSIRQAQAVVAARSCGSENLPCLVNGQARSRRMLIAGEIVDDLETICRLIEDTGRRGRRGPGDRERFATEDYPVLDTITKIGTALPEVANRRTAGTAVRDVPCLRSIVAGVGGIADGEPVGVAGCHGCGGNTNLNVVNAITEDVSKEQGAVTSI